MDNKLRCKRENSVVYKYLRAIAEADEPCPPNPVINRDLAMSGSSIPSKAIYRLERQGLLKVVNRHYRGYARQIVFNDGLATRSADEALDDIVAKAAVFFEVRHSEIIGPARGPHIIPARFAACLVAQISGYSYELIGQFLARDHATIIYAVRRARKMRKNDSAFADLIAGLLHSVGIEPRPVERIAA